MTNETIKIAEIIDQSMTGYLPESLIPFKNLLIAVLIVLSSVIAAKIVFFFVEKYFKKIAEKTETRADDLILELIHKPIYYAIILLGVQIAADYLLQGSPYMAYFTKGVTILFISIIAYVTAGIASILINELGGRIASKTESTLDDEAIPFLSKLVKFGIYALGVMIILSQLGIEITPLVASLGIAGIAIGFAAKDTLSNLMAGFFILVDRPFARGDRIQVGSFSGEVVDIGLRTTKIQTPDHTFVIIPNEKVVINEVTNYALPDSRLKVMINFGVAYGSDVEKVKKTVMDVAMKSSSVLKDPEPQVFFKEFADSSLNFLLVAWIESFKDQLKITDELNTGVYNALNREKIEIPFPTQTIYLKKE
ncbi:MAG: mechanosensitive ion channel family protein [Candidatus Altiarchaeia archaeon]